MTRNDVTETLRGIFATILELPPSAVISDLSPDTCEKWDSLHHIHLVSAIEESFGITLGVEAEVEILTFELAVIVVCDILKSDGRLAA
jgi:acyl carrier protein